VRRRAVDLARDQMAKDGEGQLPTFSGNHANVNTRNFILIVFPLLAAVVIAYGILQRGAVLESQHPSVTDHEQGLSAALNDALHRLTREVETYQAANVKQLQHTQAEQQRLRASLAEVVNRLAALEATIAVQGAGDNIESATAGTAASRDGGKAAPKQVSEAELGQWLDETLHASGGDAQLTTRALEQALSGVTKLPGVSLEDMQCEQRFCRATFFAGHGEAPKVEELFGEPPFMTEMFTIPGANGRVLVYFTQPGVTLEDIRRANQKL